MRRVRPLLFLSFDAARCAAMHVRQTFCYTIPTFLLQLQALAEKSYFQGLCSVEGRAFSFPQDHRNL